MSLSYEKYKRTTVNLPPDLEQDIEHEAEKRRVTKRQIMIDWLRLGQTVSKGENIDVLYGKSIKQTMIEIGEENAKSINKEIHNSLYKSFYSAIKDKFEYMEQVIVAILLMLATLLSSLSDGQETIENLYNSFLAQAEKKLSERKERLKTEERH